MVPDAQQVYWPCKGVSFKHMFISCSRSFQFRRRYIVIPLSVVQPCGGCHVCYTAICCTALLRVQCYTVICYTALLRVQYCYAVICCFRQSSLVAFMHLCVGALLCVCLCTTCMPGVFGGQKRALDPLELKVQIVVSAQESAGN